MDSLLLFLCLGLLVAQASGSVLKGLTACPVDYKRRVETCIMEAKVAPQAGGGITLVISKDTIVDLCDRGLLRKTIDCLEEIHSRCAHNTTVTDELDRLYSVEAWQQGAQLLCEDADIFQSNFECFSRTTGAVMTCVLMRTHTFRMGLTFTDPEDYTRMRQVTCNFAESIVKCLRVPLLESRCDEKAVKRIAGAMHRFLPPFCITDNYITVTQAPALLMATDGATAEQ